MSRVRFSLKAIKSMFGGQQKPASVQAKEQAKVDFDSKYKVGKVLGKGNFSVVKLCTDKATGEELAVKIIIKKHMSAEDLQGLKQEVAILEAMDHPNVLRMVGFYEDKTRFLIVTELAQQELFDKIVAKEFYTEKDAAKVMRILFEAIGFLHANGVVHRDLKPENVLLMDKSDDGSIKLADFGFAHELDQSSEQAMLQTACGTPGYVAPEIIKGKKYGKEVDLWSLGVIMYILLCGYPPFYHQSQAQLFRLIKKGKYDFDPEYWSDVSEEAKDLIRRCLTVDPASRLTADEALQHPWIQKLGVDHDLTPSLQQLKSYQARRRLKTAFNTALAATRMQRMIGKVAQAAREEAIAEEGDEPAEVKKEEE